MAVSPVASANMVGFAKFNQDSWRIVGLPPCACRRGFVKAMSKPQLEAIVSTAFKELPPELRSAGGRAKRGSAAGGAGARRSSATAQADEEYRRVLTQYQQAVEAAGSGHDPRIPQPDLAQLRPYEGGRPVQLSCLDRAQRRTWPAQSRRPVSAGAPSLGKRR